jgi:hypothetical protein
MSTAEPDQDLAWRWRRQVYATEIARLQAEGGTVDPAVTDTLNLEKAGAELNERYHADLKKIAQAGYERIFEIIAPLTEHLPLLTTAPRGCGKPESAERNYSSPSLVRSTKSTRRLKSHRPDCPAATVADFLAARRVDTTVALD